MQSGRVVLSEDGCGLVEVDIVGDRMIHIVRVIPNSRCSGVQEVFDVNTCLLDDCPHGTFWEIARMVGDRCAVSSLWVPPDLVTSTGGPVEDKPKATQFPRDVVHDFHEVCAREISGTARNRCTLRAEIVNGPILAWASNSPLAITYQKRNLVLASRWSDRPCGYFGNARVSSPKLSTDGRPLSRNTEQTLATLIA